MLEKLSELTFADKRYDEAASAYRRLYDAATTRSGREAAMTGYVRATVAGGDGERIAAMAADVAEHPDAEPRRCANPNTPGPGSCGPEAARRRP